MTSFEFEVLEYKVKGLPPLSAQSSRQNIPSRLNFSHRKQKFTMGKGVYKCSGKDCTSLPGFTNSAGLRSHMREIHTNLCEIALPNPGRSDCNLDSMMENWTADETSAKLQSGIGGWQPTSLCPVSHTVTPPPTSIHHNLGEYKALGEEECSLQTLAGILFPSTLVVFPLTNTRQ